MLDEVRTLWQNNAGNQRTTLTKQILFSWPYQLSRTSSTQRMRIASDDNNRDAIYFVHDEFGCPGKLIY
jgi:hypothetical protein